MPYVIEDDYVHERMATAEYSEEVDVAFFRPFRLGEPLPANLPAITPNPLLVNPPLRGNLPDIFNNGGEGSLSSVPK